ncbi:Xaa-Pro peptidase family protein [soil metagenome]
MTGAVPQAADLERWQAADRQARPARVGALRERLARQSLDGYFGVRRENTRYLTGFELEDGEEKVAGNSGQFFVSADEVVVLADSRYTAQAAEQCPDARLEGVYQDFAGRWPDLLASLRPISSANGLVRLAVEAGFVSHATWQRLAEASPAVELVPVEGWVEEQRQTKEPAEIERIAAACAVADQALRSLLPRIRPGATEAELALELEWLMRTGGAEALAFGVACLAGPRAALPHGSPGPREVAAGEVLLFDFGAQVGGYRSDMTRTLFVGQPSARDLEIYRLVADGQAAALTLLETAASEGRSPLNRAVDAAARDVISIAGHGAHFGHGLGHGIGLATHELPSLGRLAPPAELPTPTVFSVEPGVYLDGQTGVRIEDLVLFDTARRRLERLTGFPREVTVVGE